MSTLRHADDIKGVIELGVKGANFVAATAVAGVTAIGVHEVGRLIGKGKVIRGIYRVSGWIAGTTAGAAAWNWLDNHNLNATKKFLDTLI